MSRAPLLPDGARPSFEFLVARPARGGLHDVRDREARQGSGWVEFGPLALGAAQLHVRQLDFPACVALFECQAQTDQREGNADARRLCTVMLGRVGVHDVLMEELRAGV